MKKWLCALIASTFLGSSYTLFNFGSISVYLFRVILLLFLLFFGLANLTAKTTKVNYPFLNKYKIYLGFLAFFTLITLSNAPAVSIWFNGCLFLATNIALMYFVFIYTDTEEDLKKYIYSYMIGIFVTMVISIYEYHTGNHVVSANYTSVFSINTWEFRVLSKYPTAFLYNPNNIGVAMLIAIGFGLVFLQQKKRYGKTLFFIWALLSLYVAFITGSRGSIVFVIIGFFLTSLNTSNKFSGRMVGILLLGVLSLIVYLIFQDFFWDTLEGSGLLNESLGQSTGDQARWRLIKAAWEVCLDTSFIGVGPRGAEAVIRRYYGYAVASIHNFFPELFVTLGAGGLVTFVFFYIRCLKVQLSLRKHTRYANLILVALIMFLLAGTIPPTIFTLHFIWLIFAFSLANEKLYYLQTNKTIK